MGTVTVICAENTQTASTFHAHDVLFLLSVLA
jgi:hypothetical protein